MQGVHYFNCYIKNIFSPISYYIVGYLKGKSILEFDSLTLEDLDPRTLYYLDWYLIP